MDAARKDPAPDAPVALAVLTVIVYVAGFAMVAAWFALLILGQPGQPTDSVSRAPGACTICGVVERVGEIKRAGVQLQGEQSESFVVVLAALGGLRSDASPRLMYETSVLHDDGSVRVVRDFSVPHWKQGDRVRVMKGRVESVALAGTGN